MPGPMVAEGITALVKHLRAARPRAKILLLGIFPRDRHSADLDKWIQEINAIIAKLDDGKQVVFLDLRDKFLAPEDKSAPGVLRQFLPDVMKDGVHPSRKGYEVWADAIKGPLGKMVGK
jgi:lysophospholipase L1-like esterase